MPELPEVETVRKGLAPHLVNQTIADVIVRHQQLRFPVPRQLKSLLTGQVLQDLTRRGKYLLFKTAKGTLILHLGMSGSIRVLLEPLPAKKHDHLDIIFKNQRCLRFNDPRRFGMVLWTSQDPLLHPLLASLGPEPLDKTFNGQYLWEQARKRKLAVKSFIMNSKIVVGVGNIYAAESLFMSGLHPLTPVNKISRAQFDALVDAVKTILQKAIKSGGTTLKDFVKSDGKPGYFKQALQVYGRQGQACFRCGKELKLLRIGQRATVFCPQCQALHY